jgi:hypothetical protein
MIRSSSMVAKWKGANVFDGEITSARLVLPVGMPWRRWIITAADYNGILDEHYLGVPVGSSWVSNDGGATYVTVDAGVAACFTYPDDAKIIHWLVNTVQRPDGSTFDSTTYVNSLIPASVLQDPVTNESHLSDPQGATYRSVINEVRGLAGFPIFAWFDPDGYYHWTVFPDPAVTSGSGLPLGLPETPYQTPAPAAIVDASPNGTTTVGGRGLEIDYDGSYMPQAVYVTGVTDYVYNSGSYLAYGTGWGAGVTAEFTNPAQNLRQILVDAQSSTVAERDAIGGAYATFGKRARIKGMVDIGRPDEAVDGWRCGQALTITDARLPTTLDGAAFTIQRVQGTLVAGQSFVKYHLEFGDGPIATFSQKFQQLPAARKVKRQQPAIRYQVRYSEPAVPSTTLTVYAQAVDRSSLPVKVAKKHVVWSLVVTDQNNYVVTGQGSISPTTGTTDADGQAYTVLTTGSQDGLNYAVTAKT